VEVMQDGRSVSVFHVTPRIDFIKLRKIIPAFKSIFPSYSCMLLQGQMVQTC